MKTAATRVLRLSPFVIAPVLAICIAMVESAVHIAPAFRKPPDVAHVIALAGGNSDTWRDVSLPREGDTRLSAWWVKPAGDSQRGVILLHGVADTRAGVRGHAQYLLRAGYAVLMPDSRGHGVSGGDVVSYGILERDDVLAWIAWMHQQGTREVYGLGISMGAAILLQTLPDSGLAAVVAESPFSCFPAIASDRLSQVFRIRAPWFRTATAPLVSFSAAYARLRYSEDLLQACPERALQADAGHTPVLLIHGMKDGNIPISHSRYLNQRFSTNTTLWEVPDADHVQALGRAYDEYSRRVLAFFQAATDGRTGSPSESIADTRDPKSRNPSSR